MPIAVLAQAGRVAATSNSSTVRQVPIPGQFADPPSNECLREIRILIRASIRHAGGKLEGLSSLKAEAYAESEADSIAEVEQREAEACAEFEADPAHREDGSLT